MNVQSIIQSSRVVQVRELKAEITRLKAENAALRGKTAALESHFDLALLAARDLETLAEDARLVIVDGWNLILGAKPLVRSREELLERAKKHLETRPQDFVWIVFDGPQEATTCDGRLRVSYTGGEGAHRADRMICDFLRMARFRGKLDRIEVETRDKDFLAAVKKLREK